MIQQTNSRGQLVFRAKTSSDARSTHFFGAKNGYEAKAVARFRGFDLNTLKPVMTPERPKPAPRPTILP